MSEQYDSHQARVDRTNTNWQVGTVGALIGANVLGATTGQSLVLYGALEGGNIGHRVYQETGDKGLAAEVGAVRGVFGVVAVCAFVAMFWTGLGTFATVMLTLDNVVNHGSLSPAFLGAVVLGGMTYGTGRIGRTIYVENRRLKVTGMPRDKYLVHAGYVSVGDLWVRPAPGYTVADTLAAFGYGAPVIDV